MKRLSKDEYFMRIAHEVSGRATCSRAKVGCILVRNDRIIATGYNGSPSKLPHCDDVGHDMVNGHCVRTSHAEKNAIYQCAKEGVSAEFSVAYCTMYPCVSCASALYSVGVTKVFYRDVYASMSQDDVVRMTALEIAGFSVERLRAMSSPLVGNEISEENSISE